MCIFLPFTYGPSLYSMRLCLRFYYLHIEALAGCDSVHGMTLTQVIVDGDRILIIIRPQLAARLGDILLTCCTSRLKYHTRWRHMTSLFINKC